MKVFIITTIATEEQNVSVMPTEDQIGLIIEAKELDEKTLSGRIYLNKDEAEALILKIQEMIKYLEL
jgi:hypothetical protein